MHIDLTKAFILEAKALEEFYHKPKTTGNYIQSLFFSKKYIQSHFIHGTLKL